MRAITEKNDGANRLEDDIDAQLIKAEKNKQSILASAFTGKVIPRVMGHIKYAESIDKLKE